MMAGPASAQVRARARGDDELSRSGRPLTRIDGGTTTDLTALAVERRHLRSIETRRRIREMDPNARVAMITARSKTSVVREVLEAGAADFHHQAVQPRSDRVGAEPAGTHSHRISDTGSRRRQVAARSHGAIRARKAHHRVTRATATRRDRDHDGRRRARRPEQRPGSRARIAAPASLGLAAARTCPLRATRDRQRRDDLRPGAGNRRRCRALDRRCLARGTPAAAPAYVDLRPHPHDRARSAPVRRLHWSGGLPNLCAAFAIEITSQ